MMTRTRKMGAILAIAGTMMWTSPPQAAGLYTNGVPSPSTATGTLPLSGAETIPADTNLAGGSPPQTVAVTTSQLAAFFAFAWQRNYLDNGAMAVAQRTNPGNIPMPGLAVTGTGVPIFQQVTGGTTTIAGTANAADRWFVDTNVAVGAGKGMVVNGSAVNSQAATFTVTPPTGFQQSLRLWRDSGALLQPVCVMQEIETSRATQLAGKNVVLSTYLQALAGLTATANAVSGFIITGTGTDQGLATLTASPAITPAWTNIAGGTGAAATWNTTTSWVRYATPVVAIPATATEVGVMICFTPVGSSSGITDGIAVTGVQLEVVGSGLAVGAVPYPSTYEFRPYQLELLAAQRFFYMMPELGSALLSSTGPMPTSNFCEATAAAVNLCIIPLPIPMRGTTPTITLTTTGTWSVNIAGVSTALSSPTAATCTTTACGIKATNTNTAGQVELFHGVGGGGMWEVRSDVVM